jgi:acetyl-CoA carboxylase carboxyl transferase subunit beta
MSWFKREMASTNPVPAPRRRGCGRQTVRTEGLWIKCVGCRAVIWKADLEANLNVCPKCQHHFKIGAASASACCSNPAMSWWTAACAPPTR